MAKAREIRGLTCDESFRSAAGKILWTRFEELMSFREMVLKPTSRNASVDAIHDMRVASRRLRASLEVFVDIFPKGGYRTMLSQVKYLADALGEVRDVDVMSEWLRAARRGKTLSQRQALDSLISDMDMHRPDAHLRLKTMLEDLERHDFPRRFALFVAQETV